MRDTISTLLTSAAIFMRLKNREKALKAFNDFVKTVEGADVSDTPEVVRVMEEFVEQYKNLGYAEQGEKLAVMVRLLKARAPGMFAPEGRELEEWERPEFGCDLPVLPYSINGSRSQPGLRGLFIGTCVAVFVGGGIIWLSIEPLLNSLHINDLVALLYLCSVPLGGVIACSMSDRRSKQKEQSWCKVTEQCIEYCSPVEHFIFRWNEVSSVVRSREPGVTRGGGYSVTQIQGPGSRKIEVSGRFFKDEEVETLYRICKLRHMEQGSIR